MQLASDTAIATPESTMQVQVGAGFMPTKPNQRQAHFLPRGAAYAYEYYERFQRPMWEGTGPQDSLRRPATQPASLLLPPIDGSGGPPRAPSPDVPQTPLEGQRARLLPRRAGPPSIRTVNFGDTI